MSPLSVLVRIRLAEIIRKPSGAFWFFALPLILLLLVAALFHNGHPFERRHIALVVVAPSDAEASADAEAISRALDAHVRKGGIALDRVPDEAGASARLESRAVSAVVISTRRPGARIERDGDRDRDGDGDGRVLRVVVGEREEIFGRGLLAAFETDNAHDNAQPWRRPARLEITQLAQSGYVQFLVPGMLAQGVVVAGLFGMGHAMVRYRQSRFLRKLATTPLSRAEFVLAQIIARVVLVSLQLLLMLVVAKVAFGVHLSLGAIVWVLVVGAAGLVSFLGIGFLISCLVKTEEMVVDIINALSVPIALLSEIFFSSAELPRPVALLSSALPSTAMVRAMRAVLLHGDNASSAVVPALGILGVWAIVTFTIAVRAFKWR